MGTIKYNTCITGTNLLGLRTADHVRFNYIDDSSTEIICTKEMRVNGEEKVKTHSFEMFSSVISETNPNLKLSARSASFYIPWSFYNWEIQTAFRMLEESDEVELLWVPDRVPDLELEGVSKKVFMDVLKLIIYKKEWLKPEETQQFHYVLGTHICTAENRLVLM